MKVIDGNTKMARYEDGDIWTSDKQQFTGTFDLRYARSTQESQIQKMLRYYAVEAYSDDALERLVLATVPECVKAVTTTYTLEDMVG